MSYRTVQILPAFPEFAAFAQSLRLGGRSWTFEYEWRPRLQVWLVDIYDDEFNAVVEGRAVLVGSNLAYGVLDFPGALIVLGLGDNDQTQLGKRVNILYIEFEDD